MEEKKFKAVFFDLGGTLRIALKNEAYFRHARRKMAEIAGTDMPYEEFYAMIDERYKPYRKMATSQWREAGDEELWCKWLLPDYPDMEHLKKICHEMTFQYRQSVGYRVLVDGGREVLWELHNRGYKLGIISNLIGENEVPDWIEEEGFQDLFDVVLLSSCCGLRKPGKEIYQLACEKIGCKPEECVSVADNTKTDLPGACAAGITMNIIYDSPEKKHPVTDLPEGLAPSCIIKDFREVLNYLP
ncbi:MAG: HAD family hydrolase [Clostridia bacterium]|nr:HAD family hydrolase [Clostridia bacterium]